MALLGVFVFADSYLRLGDSFCDLGKSAAYYFCKLFGIEKDITVTVNGYSEVFSWGTVLPENFDEFIDTILNIKYTNIVNLLSFSCIKIVKNIRNRKQ